jgi:hypothetical protein
MRKSKDPDGDPASVKARRRVMRLGTNELLNWADVASSGLMRGFEDYRKTGDVFALDEIKITLVSLAALTDELIIRHEVENS